MIGTICHRCYPEHHTYLALFFPVPSQADGSRKIYQRFVAAGWSEALRKGEKMGATEIYRRISKSPAPECDKDENNE